MLALCVIVGLLCVGSGVTAGFVAFLAYCVATDIVRMEKRLDALEADGEPWKRSPSYKAREVSK